MNILIDGRPFLAPSAGISNFLEGSLASWARLKPHDTFYVPLPRNLHATFDASRLPSNVRLIPLSNFLLRRLPNLVWLCLMMPLLARRWKTQVYYTPLPCLPFLLPRQTRTIIVVHDVVNLEFRETMQWTNIVSNRLFFNRSIRKANVIWTNSLYTKGKVEQYFPKRRCQQIFTGCAVDNTTYRALQLSESEETMFRQRMGIKGRYILFVGSLEPRKNLSFLLSLMPDLYQHHQLQLVVVGGHGWKNSTLSMIVNADNFPKESTVFCGFVSNSELAQLYNMADSFVSASLNEGFGMPQLEALFCGCPVVTAHNSAMIEIASGKEGAVTVDGYDKQHWIDAIVQQVEKHPKVNPAQLQEYNWDSIVKRLFTHCF